jgi:hypothetical protein
MWALGTWRGRLIDYPAALESERAYIVTQFDGRLRCYWQTRGTAPADVSCRVTSTDAASPPNVQMLRTPRGTLAGTWRALTGTDVYKLELTRISEQMVLWPYLGMPIKASPATAWAVGQWSGHVQGLPKGSDTEREFRIEVVGDTLRCRYRGTTADWSAAACAFADRKVEFITAGGAEFLLAFNGRLLTGTVRSRNADRSYPLSMQKVR